MIRTFLAAATLALFAASPVLAQSTAGGMMASGYQMTKTDALASKVIGSPVYSTVALNNGATGTATPPTTTNNAGGMAPATASNAKGAPATSATDTNAQQIGTVRDLIMSTDGKVSAVVIGIGGVLGIGEKNVAVAYSDVSWAIAQDGSIRGTLATTADALKSAPAFQYPTNGQATNGDMSTTAVTNNGNGAMTPAANGAAAMQPVTNPQTFANTAGISNMFEIQSSQLALQKASAADVKAFAQKMIQDHTAAAQQMQTAAQSEHVTVPTALDQPHQQQLTQLQGLSGKQFDQAYIPMQVTAHDNAVALFQGYSQSGAAGALKDFAGKTLPTLQMHQKMIHQIAGK